MGNNQCVSQRNSNSLWNKIENDLGSKNSTREKKILNEFINLKRMIGEKKCDSSNSNHYSIAHSKDKNWQKNQIRTLKELNEFIELNPSMILIKCDSNLNKRMKRFVKWYNIASISKKDEISIIKKNKNVFKRNSDFYSPLKNLKLDVNSLRGTENNLLDELKSFNVNLSNLDLTDRNFSSPCSNKKKETKTSSNLDLYFILDQGSVCNQEMNSKPRDCNMEDGKQISILKNPHLTYEINSKDSNKFSESIDPDNLIEYNLRQFHIKNKKKFLDRVSKGPPDSFRWLAWKICAGINISTEVGESILDHFYYKPLDEDSETQIRKDLPRTLGEDFCYDHPEIENILYKILRAFANLDKDVKYCQGMNFLVRFLLMISDFNPHETFLMIVYLFSKNSFNTESEYSIFNGVRGFYLDNFIILKFYIYVFNYYFEKNMSNLYHHVNKLELPIEVWILKWFQTLYAIYLPTSSVARLWDCLISIGLDFIIDFTLAILKSKEKKILKINEAFELVDFFKTEFCNNMTEIEEIIKIAKNLNKSRSEKITSLKQEYEKLHNIKIDVYNVVYELNKNLFYEKISSNFFISSCAISESRGENSKFKKDKKCSLPFSDTNQSINSFIRNFRRECNWEDENRAVNKQSDLVTLSNFITTKSNTGTAINKSNTIVTINNNFTKSPTINTEEEKFFNFSQKFNEDINANKIKQMNCISVNKCFENESDIGNTNSICNEFSSENDSYNDEKDIVTKNVHLHTIEIKKDIGIARYIREGN